ncbi:hypothetical protein HPB47_002049 [Ixodes persulcatus]|uniref:Uncharacterized protein n=1 Tax=Ixodes persulcatus TaxID=34615 RepID=A0AC60PNJ5_IXOPE|nr:hypothetical protein HPB47_002049 [Ixodes persulcatus]
MRRTPATRSQSTSSAKILALIDRMFTTLQMVTERLAAVTGGTGGQLQPDPGCRGRRPIVFEDLANIVDGCPTPYYADYND